MPADTHRLCLQCALCCNGAIFADGQLQPGEDAAHLAILGLRIKALKTTNLTALPKFSQPCTALNDCRCTIYAERPAYCRQFECALLKQVIAGQRTADQALRVVSTAKKRAAKVLRLLRELGDNAEDVPLGTRFRRLSRRIHQQPIDDTISHQFSELTLAMHDLTVILSREFYPGGKE